MHQSVSGGKYNAKNSQGDFVIGQLLYLEGERHIYTLERIMVGFMWRCVIGWGKNIEVASFFILKSSRARGRHLIRLCRKGRKFWDVSVVRQTATSPCSLGDTGAYEFLHILEHVHAQRSLIAGVCRCLNKTGELSNS